MIHLIKNIEEVKPFELVLKFNTGETRKVNLESKLKQWSQSPSSRFRLLLDPAYFMTVKLNSEIDSIYWDNGIDFCPDTLYEWSE